MRRTGQGMIMLRIVFAVSLLIVAADALAQKVYKWVDEQGRVQYTQKPPPEGVESDVKEVKTTELSPLRKRYCAAIREAAIETAMFKLRGYTMRSVSEAVRAMEVSRGLNVGEVALRELVSFVWNQVRPGVDVNEVGNRAFDACVGGSFGTLGEGKVDSAEAGPQQRKGPSSGTGWVAHGLVVTNHHVIEGSRRIRIRLVNGEERSAMVRSRDTENDVAVLSVNGSLPPGLPIASAEAGVGAEVFTLGYPHIDIMGSNAKLTTGIVNSATGMQDDPRIYQVSVPVQAGNSGGPLLNRRGEVVGLVTAKLSAAKVYQWTGDLPQNVNYAVKIRFARALLGEPRGETLPAESADLEQLAARVGPSVVMVIAE